MIEKEERTRTKGQFILIIKIIMNGFNNALKFSKSIIQSFLLKEETTNCLTKNSYNKKIENNYSYNTTYVNEPPNWMFPSRRFDA